MSAAQSIPSGHVEELAPRPNAMSILATLPTGYAPEEGEGSPESAAIQADQWQPGEQDDQGDERADGDETQGGEWQPIGEGDLGAGEGQPAQGQQPQQAAPQQQADPFAPDPNGDPRIERLKANYRGNLDQQRQQLASQMQQQMAGVVQQQVQQALEAERQRWQREQAQAQAQADERRIQAERADIQRRINLVADPTERAQYQAEYNAAWAQEDVSRGRAQIEAERAAIEADRQQFASQQQRATAMQAAAMIPVAMPRYAESAAAQAAQLAGVPVDVEQARAYLTHPLVIQQLQEAALMGKEAVNLLGSQLIRTIAVQAQQRQQATAARREDNRQAAIQSGAHRQPPRATPQPSRDDLGRFKATGEKRGDMGGMLAALSKQQGIPGY